MIRTVLELSIMLPGAVACYIPMKGHLYGREKMITLLGIPFLILWIIAGGAICYKNNLRTVIWLLPSLILFGFIFYKTVSLSAWKSISVFLAVCGTFSCMKNLAIVVDAMVFPQNNSSLLGVSGGIVYFLLCCSLVVALWYPSTHAARWLLAEFEMPGTWYVFWILPAFFIMLNCFIQPHSYTTLYINRMMVIYPIMVIALLILMLFCYMMFYLMARGLSKNMRLTQENEFLQMQSAQYRILQKNMEETRRARHDLRQHITVIQSCIDGKNWEKLEQYIKDYSKNLPSDVVRSYCKNYAVNALLRYYAEKALKAHTDIDISVSIGEKTIIPEPEFCVLLGNLLENAIEACLMSDKERKIKVVIKQTGASMLSMIIDNTSPQEPMWEKGKLLSCKHDGFGMGTESVYMITQRYNGDARFEWKDNVFYTSIMLNP